MTSAMLLSECVNSLDYPLAWSRVGQYTATFVLACIAAVGLLLHPYIDLVALIWLGVWRCYVIWRRDVTGLRSVRLQLNSRGVIRLKKARALANARSLVDLNDDEAQYQAQSVVMLPGFGWLCLQSMSGKRLEILIFYRYDLRHSYRRLMRHFYQQSATQNYDQVR